MFKDDLSFPPYPGLFARLFIRALGHVVLLLKDRMDLDLFDRNTVPLAEDVSDPLRSLFVELVQFEYPC